MANARGGFPLTSNWFRDRVGRRSRAELLRTTPLQDPAVKTIWSDYFFPAGIQFVGAITGQSLDSAITLDLTNLSGGIDSTAREGDFVVVAHFNRNNTVGDQPVGVSTSGFTEVADLFGDDDVNANLSVSHKRMGSTPDTSITTEIPAGRNVAIAYVLRGVDATTPLDVTATTATAINTGIADPPSITPATAGAWVLAIGGSVSGATTALNGPNNFGWSVNRVNSGGSSPWGHLGIAALRWPGSGAVDPGAWTGVTDSLTYATCSVTLAIRPAQPAIGVTLAATEAADTAAFAISASHTASMAVTEAADTAAFVLDSAASASLAATESADVAAFTLSTGTDLSLAATEARDVAAFDISARHTLSLAATEAADTASFAISARHTLSLAATESADTASFAINASHTATLAATEAADTASFTLTAVHTLNLAATEGADVAAFTVSSGTSLDLAATEASDVASFAIDARHTASLAATEASDVASFAINARHTASLAATEASDTASFAINARHTAALAATEAPDVAAFAINARTIVTLGATEAPDVAAFALNARTTALMNATEAPDIAAFSLSILGARAAYSQGHVIS